MSWLIDLFMKESVAQSVVVLGLVTALGLALGSLRIRSVSLGIAGVLFVGILFGHYGIRPNHEILEFAREFGLILFVYTIGLQVGPGFFSSLKRDGLPLNILAFCIVTLGLVIAVLVHKMGGVPLPVAAGLFSGATTNTPSLAAAQQAVHDVVSYGSSMGGTTSTLSLATAAVQNLTPERITEISKMPGLGYAVAYPFGVFGIILTMLFFRFIFRVDVKSETAEFVKRHSKATPKVSTTNLEVKNANLDGLKIGEIPMISAAGVVISRVLHGDRVEVAQGDTVLHTGDVLHCVGPADNLKALRVLIGAEAKVDVKAIPSSIASRRILITNKGVLGKSLSELQVLHDNDVTITRVSRAEVEFTPSESFELHFGDTVLAVGKLESIERVMAVMGNSTKRLNHPQLIPVFVGIVLGIIVGSIPVKFPGMPAPVKLGMAGGPLLVAIILSRIGRLGPLNYFMPISANFMLRELGISLFLACVGLKAGDSFVATLQGDGLMWMGYGALITAVPLLIVGFVARIFMKMNFMNLCGLLAGSMTDPPALAFATSVAGNESPSVAYATVYPLTMILRVLYAQTLILLLANAIS